MRVLKMVWFFGFILWSGGIFLEEFIGLVGGLVVENLFLWSCWMNLNVVGLGVFFINNGRGFNRVVFMFLSKLYVEGWSYK